MTEHFVSPTGSDTWANSTSSSTPCSLATAVTNVAAGDIVTLRAGTYDIDTILNPAAGSMTSGRIVWRAYPAETPTLRATANVRIFTGKSFTTYQGLNFTTNSGTKTTTAAIYCPAANIGCVVQDCTITGLQRGIELNDSFFGSVTNCNFVDCVTAGFAGGTTTYTFRVSFFGCRFSNCGTGILATYVSGVSSMNAVNCLIVSNATAGIDVGADSGFTNIIGCTFASNGKAISISGALSATGSYGILVKNCLIANNTYGIYAIADSDRAAMENYNAYYSNTSGNLTNISAGANDVTLTQDPFVNSAGGDFSLNVTAGGGASCRGVGFPATIIGSSTDSDMDIGLTQAKPVLPSEANVWYGSGAYGYASGLTPSKRANSITNCSAGNIKKDVVIDNVTGTYEAGGGGVIVIED
jgi:hypothetical protein